MQRATGIANTIRIRPASYWRDMASRLNSRCLHSSSKRGRDIGEITQQLFKDVGVTANPAGFDFGPVIKKVLSGQYQVSTWRISSRPDQGPALFLSLHSKSRANFSRYKNPEMDKLLVAQRMETDPERRNEILCKIARLINDDVPFLSRRHAQPCDCQ
jgi:ABC-type transport system substrate-binding protein